MPNTKTELDRIWKEAVMAQLQVLSWNTHGETEQRHAEFHAEYPVSQPDKMLPYLVNYHIYHN